MFRFQQLYCLKLTLQSGRWRADSLPTVDCRLGTRMANGMQGFNYELRLKNKIVFNCGYQNSFYHAIAFRIIFYAMTWLIKAHFTPVQAFWGAALMPSYRGWAILLLKLDSVCCVHVITCMTTNENTQAPIEFHKIMQMYHFYDCIQYWRTCYSQGLPVIALMLVSNWCNARKATSFKLNADT